ncbi:hypothetical protein [Bacillus licheniformis]|uniref:hypothetical protein n=1 Tax=Bacillus licheniformis TaxID=1402 RepID=UPI00119E5F31|nr:hypothetical protein [Bacillus licheniformis]TWN76612.1 hypothetical protein CHCC20494_0675 [Bacillus licheniformis]
MQDIKPFNILRSGAKVYNLKDLVKANFEEAQNILDYGEYTKDIDVESAYEERLHHGFTGIYECCIDSIQEYNNFVSMLSPDTSYYPSIEEWKNNRIVYEGRTIRLGKWLKKEGYTQDIIDSYSAQVKTGKEKYYFTISDLPQHITGMAFYSDTFESCQHPDHEDSVHLAGALYDNGLYIGMLHKHIDDLEDMEGLLLARVLFRVVEYQGVTHLIPSRYYGSVETKDIMDRCIRQLEEKHIHTNDVRYDMFIDDDNDKIQIKQRANGKYHMSMIEDVILHEEVNHDEDIDCPLCSGSGKYKAWLKKSEKEIDVPCPMCFESGKYKVSVSHVIDEIIEVEDCLPISTYADDYTHNGDHILIDVKASKMREHMEKYPM